MPVYDFNPAQIPRQPTVPDGVRLPETPSAQQLSHVQGGRTRITGDVPLLALPYDVEECPIPGFHALDEGLKHYFSGIRIPTKDSYRFMRIKVAGGDRSLLVWNDELVGGRARLPLAAIDRTGYDFNPDKYSNTTLPMTIRYLGKRGDRAAKVFRPVPYLVEYTLIIWGARKRDVEYALFDIGRRFNPLAEFRIFDGCLQGTVQLRFGGMTDASDKEAGYDQHANVRYELTMTAEAWLPLPEVIVPTVLGRVTTFRERTGQVLLSQLGDQIYASG